MACPQAARRWIDACSPRQPSNSAIANPPCPDGTEGLAQLATAPQARGWHQTQQDRLAACKGGWPRGPLLVHTGMVLLMLKPWGALVGNRLERFRHPNALWTYSTATATASWNHPPLR